MQSKAQKTRAKLTSKYWASFVGTPEGETLFVGIFGVRRLGLLPEDQAAPHRDGIEKAGSLDEYELVLDERLGDRIGRLYVDWGHTKKRAWIQRADLQDKPIYEGSRGGVPSVSIAAGLLREIEATGDLPKMANAESGWFAVVPGKWQALVSRAEREGRDGPNLIVYRTTTREPRDHHVIPFAVTSKLLTDATAPIRADGTRRWEMTLKADELRVTHGAGVVDVSEYRGATLPGERAGDGDYYTTRSGVGGPDELPPGGTYPEGAAKTVLVNAYERDPRCRAACLAHYGPACFVCGMAFGDVYGPEFVGRIHVHHLDPVSTLGGREVEPVRDLRPVCPNCHYVIHLRTPPHTPDELRVFLKRAK